MPKFYFLSTIDNPYSPITQFDYWYAFDIQNGYNSCGLLSRLVELKNKDFDNLNPLDKLDILRATIDEIVDEDPLGRYMKIVN